MELLSYVLAAAASTVTGRADTDQPKLPTFKPRFWYNPERLDARPVAWSLRNRPDEWQWKSRGYTIEHKPSGHVFWVASGPGFYHLYEADCGCKTETSSKFQRFQQYVFHRAYRHWSKHTARTSGVHDNFANHFIH